MVVPPIDNEVAPAGVRAKAVAGRGRPPPRASAGPGRGVVPFMRARRGAVPGHAAVELYPRLRAVHDRRHRCT
jgi:hypothetical protein